MKKEYIIKQMAENRWIYTFTEPNKKGETLTIDLSKCINLDAEKDKKSIPYQWAKAGYINRILTTYWNINTYVRDTEGACRGSYNPQLKTTSSTINFDWIFEATEENKQKLIDEVYRLFSSSTGKTATEEKLEKIREFAEERKVDVFNKLPEGWEILKGALTAPRGSEWISNMKPFKSGERRNGLLLIK